jgi:uncharacterized protein (TIGR02217 family)
MTGFHEVRFPDAVARGATGGPQFVTEVVTLASGFEERNQRWAQARGRWDISTGIRTREQMAEVIAFFRARKGRAHGFRFKDWQDFEAVDAECLATADPTVWQLAKHYVSGPAEELRRIVKPVAATVIVRVGGNVQTEGYTLDAATGRIAFAAPPSIAPRADFEFDVPVRFDTDQIAVTTRHFDSAIVPSIPLVEIKLRIP